MSFLWSFLFVNVGIGAITAVAGDADGILTPLLEVVCLIAGGWVSICLTTQRLHDIGRNGWVQAIPLALAVPGLLVLATADRMSMVVLGIACLFVATLGFMLWLMLAPGMPADNRYGPGPSGRS